MSLCKETINSVIKYKQEDEVNRNNPKFKGILLSNRDVAETVLGSRKAESTVRRIWKKFKQHGHYNGVLGASPIAGGSVTTPEANRKAANGKKFVITSAQNNTLVHEEFFDSLQNYCEEEGAELMVSCFHYNKNGFQNGPREDSWFDERIKQYMVNESVQLAEGLVLCGELNIIPTAVNPISGLHNYTGSDSAIIPHAKLQLESVPTPKHDAAKLMYTTGTITQMNYVQQKSGQKAAWHHSFSALVVEVDEDGDWFVRQLNAESSNGCFYDLCKYYTPKGVVLSEGSVTGLQFGDVHRDKLTTGVADMCWGNLKTSIAAVLDPDYMFFHDVHDHARRNHHSIKDPYFLFRQFTGKVESVREEVAKTVELLHEMAVYRGEVIVVESNHDLALERWLKEQNYKNDPVNAVFFLEMQLQNYYAMARGEGLQTFKTACELVSETPFENVTFLKTDESFRLHGIEMGQHGHLGINGSRPSLSTFLKQGIKFNIGHSHSANIKDGCYQAGACVLVEDAGYAQGGGSWSVSHIITYANGKRTIITCKGNKWRG